MSDEQQDSSEAFTDEQVSSFTTANMDEKAVKTGVVYISKIPRFMTPTKIRSLLDDGVGHVNRIYLKPESDARYELRVSKGGKKIRLYTEGWVEFTREKYAIRAAKYLNCTPIGGKKCGNLWHNELWCIRYLPGFTWTDLTGVSFLKEYTKKRKLTNELSRLTRESEAYVESLLRARKKKQRDSATSDTKTK